MISSLAFAVLTAFLFGVNIHVQRMALDDTDARTGALLSVAGMAAMFWLLSPWMLQADWFRQPSVFIFIGVGLMFPAMGQSLQIMATQTVGPALSASLGAFTPLFAVVLAMGLFGEDMGWQTASGIALMVFALLASTWSPSALARKFSRWALLLPLGAALVRGLAQPLSKWGMQDIPSPYFASLIASSTSLLLLLMLRPAHDPRRRSSVRGRCIFLFSGLINGAGIVSLNAALQHSAVTLVSPVVATSTLWAIALGAWWFKREQLMLKHGLVALLTFTGTLLLVLR